MMIFDDIGGVGVPKVPKMDDVIYEQSLMVMALADTGASRTMISKGLAKWQIIRSKIKTN